MKEWLNKSPEDFCNEQMLRGYKRNQKLVDLDYTPEDIKNNITKAYENAPTGTKQKLMNYFIEKRLRNLISDMDDF